MGSTSPSPAAVCNRTTVLEDQGSLPTRTVVIFPFTTGSVGRLDATVDWTFASSLIGVYIVQGTCTLDQFNARTCNFLVRSETGVKPRKVSAANTNAGDYWLLVANFAEVDESGTAQVILSTLACPPPIGVAASRLSGPATDRRASRLIVR
jgi:hypothetical protein